LHIFKAPSNPFRRRRCIIVAVKPELVVGVFDHLPDAEKAIQELWQAGFAQDRIDMITRSAGRISATPRYHWNKEAAYGALAGAAAGATVGVVAGALATIIVPGLGAVLGGGLILSAIGGAAVGAAGGTFLGPFIALGMSSDEAHYYATEIDEGSTVV